MSTAAIVYLWLLAGTVLALYWICVCEDLPANRGDWTRIAWLVVVALAIGGLLLPAAFIAAVFGWWVKSSADRPDGP